MRFDKVDRGGSRSAAVCRVDGHSAAVRAGGSARSGLSCRTTRPSIWCWIWPLRVGEVQMASGAGASDVTATVIAVTSAYGLPHCEVDVIFTSISICCQRGSELAPVTTHRVVRSRALDYTRLADGGAAGAGHHSRTRSLPPTRTTRLRDDHLPPHIRIRAGWRRSAWALMAASVAVLIGGGVEVALVAAGTTALLDRVGRLLNRRGLPFFYQQVVGGALATLRHARGRCGSGCCRPGSRRRWSSRPRSRCCCPGCPLSAPCRTPSPGST